MKIIPNWLNDDRHLSGGRGGGRFGSGAISVHITVLPSKSFDYKKNILVIVNVTSSSQRIK